MKQMWTRITALLLVLTLLTGLVPAASAAPTDAEATLDDLEYSFDGKTPLGNLITAAMDKETDASTEEFTGYNVTALEIEGNTATVTYDAMEDACLVVALYTEEGMQLLNSASMEVTADMTEATVTFEGEMPQYFTAEAYLLDSYDYSPLCTPYESLMYNRDIQELIASDIHDYEADLVLNLDDREDTNFAVFYETTKRITEVPGFNLVTTEDYENNLFVIKNADEQFTSLIVGDIIVYPRSEDGLMMAKVAGIEIDGTTVTIHGGELALEEVFSHMKLESGSAPEENAYHQQSVGTHTKGNDHVKVPVEYELKEQKFCNGKVKLSIDVVGSLEASLKYNLVYKKQTLEFKLDFEVGIQFAAEVKGKAGRFEVPMTIIPIPLLPGVVDAAVTPNLKLEFAATVSGTGSVKATTGLKVNHKKIFTKPKVKNLSCWPKFSLDVKLEGTVFFGIELEPKLLIGAGTGELNIGFKTGLELVGTFAELNLGDELHHDCAGLCISGKSKLLLAMTAEGRLLSLEVEDELVERSIHLSDLDFYMCAKHGDSGLGECPHMLRKITVSVKDENGEPVYLATVNSPEGKFLPPSDELTNEDGVVVIYLPAGKQKITAETVELTGKKTVKVGDEPKKVNIKLKTKATEEEDEEKKDALDGNGDAYTSEKNVLAYGSCGSGLNWKLENDGTLYILGQGTMDNYTTPDTNFPEWCPEDLDFPPWYDCKERIRKLVIGEGVKSIGAGAFWYCWNLTEVAIPGTVQYIGPVAFDDCEALTKLEIGNGVSSIQEGAFWNCRSLRELTIPASVVFLSDYAFGESRSLKRFNVDRNNPNFCTDSAGVLYDKSMTKLIQMPGAFSGQYNIPEGVSSIGSGAFMWCTGLTGVTIPNSTQIIGDHAFQYCSNLTDVQIRSGLRIIGEFAFCYCTRLREIVLPNSLETVYDYAFSYCDQLQSVTLKNGATSIGPYMFVNCENLGQITIPVSVTEIGECAFYGCTDLTDVYYGGTINQWSEIEIGDWNDNLYLAEIHYGSHANSHIYPKTVCSSVGSSVPVNLNGIYAGSSGSDEYGRDTAEFEGLVPGGEYVLLALASLDTEDRLAPDNLLYIGHTTAAEDGTASCTYIPREFRDRTIVVLCGPSGKDLKDAEITLPEMKPDGEVHAVEPTVVYDGVTLIEGEDYELTGDVSFVEEGTYTFRINGIRDYTGVVEYTYTVLGHEHEFAEYIPDGNATCTEDGTKTAKCLHCDLTDTRPDPGSALGHSWDEGVITREPTYETWGEKCFTCTVCGATKTEPVEPVHQHRFAFFEVVEPTCFSEGYEVYYCQDCGEVLHDNFTPMLDHTWDDGVVSVEPTVDHEGEMLYTCTVCAATKTEALPKLHVHTNMVLRKVDPTCLDRGYTIFLCTDCGEVTFGDYLNALGHSFGQWTGVGGGIEERTCQRCGHTEQQPVGGPVNPFTDVPEGSFYYEPVLWAVRNGITAGTTPTTFGPNDKCMRAHVVTFLWRAAGSPEPTRTDNPFVDVKPTDFYYKPVLWAVENGITAGLDATHFGPTSYCNRAQVVTFLHRAKGSPAPASMELPFTDVATGAWYAAPVAWAVETGVTAGLTATTFGPNSICNRAQIVTFLYRAYNN